MEYQIIKQIREHPILRKSFMDLAVEVFDLSFAQWYRQGFWTDKYIPYALISHDRVIANASVSIMDFSWQGVPKRYIQIGTVMTAPEYRNQGHCARLMREILSDWKDRCDCIYLFANDTALEFYPQFGFVPAQEYQYTLLAPTLCPKENDFIKLDMCQEDSRAIVKHCYQKSNPFSAWTMSNNYELVMFYCGDFLKDCCWFSGPYEVYYSKKLDTVCIVARENEVLRCLDVFGHPNCTLTEILSNFARPAIQSIALEFCPKQKNGCQCAPLDSEDTLFLLKGKENLFAEHKMMFPTLSHA